MAAAAAKRQIVADISELAKLRNSADLTDDVVKDIVAKLANKFKTKLAPYKQATRASHYSFANMTVERYLGREFWETSIHILKLSREEMGSLMSHRAQRNAMRNDDRILIDGALYHKALTALSESTHFGEICAALCLATGRRPTEVSKTASFVPLPSKDNWVSFSGQLKKRQGKQNGAIEIPVLVLKPEKLVKLLERARAAPGGDLVDASVSDAGKRTNAKINEIFKIIFKNATTVSGAKASVTAEVIRGAYGAIAWRTMSSMAVPETTFMGRIFGHGDTSQVPDFATSAGHYLRSLVYNYPCVPALRQFFFTPTQVLAAQLSVVCSYTTEELPKEKEDHTCQTTTSSQ
jgi:Telomere resolvase